MRLLFAAGLLSLLAGCKTPEDYEKSFSVMTDNEIIETIEMRKQGEYSIETRHYGPETNEYKRWQQMRKEHPAGYGFTTIEPVK